MPAKPESKFGQDLLKANKGRGHFTRIESWSLPGVPDIHFTSMGVSGWLELKVVNLLKVNSLTTKQIGARPHQIQWQMGYDRAGGHVFNLVHRQSSKIMQLYQAFTLDEGPMTPMEEERADVQGYRNMLDHIVARCK